MGIKLEDDWLNINELYEAEFFWRDLPLNNCELAISSEQKSIEYVNLSLEIRVYDEDLDDGSLIHLPSVPFDHVFHYQDFPNLLEDQDGWNFLRKHILEGDVTYWGPNTIAEVYYMVGVIYAQWSIKVALEHAEDGMDYLVVMIQQNTEAPMAKARFPIKELLRSVDVD